MKATLQFETGKPQYNRGKSLWTITREFNDMRHLDNFIDYICRTKNYLLDEVWYNSGELFAEGDTFYHIENVDGRRVVRESTWVSGDRTRYDFITSSREEAQHTADIINH